MKRSHLLFFVVIGLLVGCAADKEYGTGNSLFVTITNPSGAAVSSVFVEGGPYDKGQVTHDVSRSESAPVFPLTIELYPEYKPASNYALLFEFKGGDGYPDYYKAVDTSAGGKINVTFEIPGIANYADWGSAVTLAGGTNMDSAVEIPLFKQWYKSAIMSTTTDFYYKVTVKPNTPYYISLDNDTEGSGSYMGDPSIAVFEPNIGLTAGGKFSYKRPVCYMTNGSVLYIKVDATIVGETGSFAIGIAEGN